MNPPPDGDSKAKEMEYLTERAIHTSEGWTYSFRRTNFDVDPDDSSGVTKRNLPRNF